VRLRDGISLGLGGGALALSVLGVGGAVREICAGVALLVALALALELLSRSAPDRPSPLVVLIGAAAALTALQLVPLPSGVLHLLDATGDTLRADGARLARTTPWPSISLDPAATLRALTFFVTLLGLALLSLRFAATERGRFVLLAGVAITCGLAAVVAGVHILVSADALYGWYVPAHMKGVFGPLLNRNHMGGLMAIGAVLSSALAFYNRQPTQLRVLWVVITIGCATMCAATLSRGANIGMGLGFLVVGGILVARHLSSERRRRRSLRRDLPVAIVVGLGVAIALYLSAGSVMDQLADTSLTEFDKPISKYEAWKSSLELVREAPLVGVGRGAVESSLTRVHPPSGQYTFSHLENEYLAAIVDWGVPGAVLLAFAFAWCVAAAVRRWRDGPLAAAALGALAMILFQSFVDFGIELLGLAVPVTIVASTVELVPFRPNSGVLRVRLIRLALISGLVLAAGLLILPVTANLQEDHDDLLAEEIPTLDDVRASIRRHPVDYYGFGEAADVASRNGDIHAVEFLNHALALHPTHPGLHRLAARMLVGLKNYKQAAIEYSLALSMEPMPHQLLTEIVTLIPSADDVTTAIPLEYPNTDVMLHSLKELDRLDISIKWLTRIAARPQHNLQVIDTLYDLAMMLNDNDTAKATATLRLSVAHTTTSRLMLAKVQFKLKEYDVLLKDLADVKDWVGRNDEKAAAWLILCDVLKEQRSWEPALQCLHHLDGSGLQGASHYDITKRLDDINGQRTYEAKMQAAQALEKALEAKHH
jgi:O-antigen ligase